VIDTASVTARLAHVEERIAAAGGVDIQIVAVTKGFGPEAIVAAVGAGLTKVGENYAQECVPKIEAAAALLHDEHRSVPELHFIGQLQTNKIRLLAPVVDVWQSVDRPPAVAALAKRAPGARVFLQVVHDAGPGKGGWPVERVDELAAAAADAGLAIEGLMTVGPTDGDERSIRAAFAATRRAADRLGVGQCSMGMTDDLEIAIGEGSTMIRVGSALFGARPRVG
jgi:pyridoxal phosphate enzyme (YggS family)